MKRLFLLVTVLTMILCFSMYNSTLENDIVITTFAEEETITTQSFKQLIVDSSFVNTLGIRSLVEQLSLPDVELTTNQVYNLNATILLFSLLSLFMTITFSFITKKIISITLLVGIVFIFLTEYLVISDFRWLNFTVNSIAFILASLASFLLVNVFITIKKLVF